MSEARRPTTVRQSELVAAALDIIATRGIAALTTRALAERVGLSTGAIFKHFASLEALLLAVVAHVAEVLASTFPDPSLPAVERLARFVERRSQAVAGSSGIQQLMLSEQFLLALPAEGAATLERCADDSRRFVHRCVEEGQAAGGIRADLPAPAVTLVVMGTAQMLARMRTKRRLPAAEARRVLDTLMAMLAPPGDARASDHVASTRLVSKKAPTTRRRH